MDQRFRRYGVQGPYLCSACGRLSGYTDVNRLTNTMFCRNPACDFQRLIDKRHHRIVEPDGSIWEWYADGSKVQVRERIQVGGGDG